MKRRSVLWSAGVAVILLGVIAILSLTPDEPQYGNKSLTEWLDDLQGSGSYVILPGGGLVTPSATPAQVEAAVALRAMGTNAGPTLIRMLRARDSDWERKLIRLVRQQSLIKLRLKSAREKKAVALHALHELGPAAAPALTEIISDQGITEDARQSCIFMLTRIGRASWPALPSLLQLVSHTNEVTRLLAVEALGEIGPITEWPAALNGRTNSLFRSLAPAPRKPDGLSEMARRAVRILATALATNSHAASALMKWEPDFTKRALLTLNYSEAPSSRAGAALSLGYNGSRPDLAVPALVECLADTNASVRAACAEALGKFDDHANSALPALRQLFDDSKPNVRVAATNAVHHIRLGSHGR